VREFEISAVTEGCLAVPRAHATINTQGLIRLQDDFLKDETDIEAFIQTVSAARFNRFLKEHSGNKRAAIALYHANAKISQCLYLPMQIWEVSLRNRISSFLCWKYSQNWPRDVRLIRNLSRHEKTRLEDAIERQEAARGKSQVHTDAIVADLSAGFWVGLLTKSYEASFSWKFNFIRVFPGNPDLGRERAHRICSDLLDLRNRIAHHEPVYHLPLQERYADITTIIAALCDRQKAYLQFSSTFTKEWEDVKKCRKEIST
jgi:hypothetical protein